MIVAGGFLAVAIIIIMVGFVTDDEGWLAAGFGGLIGATILLAIAGFLANANYHKRRDAVITKVTKSCLPYAVTHKHENDDYIVYSCANDNKIRIIKK